MHWGSAGLAWPGILIMMIVMLLFWGGLVVLVALGLWALLRTGRTTARRGDTTLDALEIARGRYASGEISREEYERLRQDLQT
jgi:putative membrane protein